MERRYTVVGDLIPKAVEQVVEAMASKEGKRFHAGPRTAHAKRTRWAKESFPSLSKDLDVLWGAYGDLGYVGLNGRRARDTLEAMERIPDEIERRTGVKLR